MSLDTQEYKAILNKLNKIKEKSNELSEMNRYLTQSINQNFVIDDQGISVGNMDYIEQKIEKNNQTISQRLIPKIKEKL